MSEYVYQYSLTIPAGTSKSSPAEFFVPIDNLEIEAIELEVPHGPAGTMGFAIFNSGTAWKPDLPGAWIVWNGKTDTWWLDGQPNAGHWSIRGYNTGAYDHTVYTRWFVSQVHTKDLTNFPLIAFHTTNTETANLVTF